jgi:hypothetical protein
MDDKIKYALLAVGAYFAYDWWQKQQGTAPATGGAADKAAADTAAAAAKAASDKAAVTKTAEDKARADEAIRVAAVAKADADRRAAAVRLFSSYPDASLAGEAAKTGEANAVAAANTRGFKFDHHTWNYYLQAVTAQAQPDPELWAPGKTLEPVTVEQYRAMRLAAGQGMVGGMSGMGWMPTLPWSTAWQA